MRLTILGRPVTKKNSQRLVRAGGRPMVLQSRQYLAWEGPAVAQLQAEHQSAKRWGNGLAPGLESMPRSLRALVYRDRNVGDLGNYLAAICDVLERAGVVENDRLIQSFDGSRLLIDRKNPRVEIELMALPDLDVPSE
jgi:Holliday junction resolvase RusA-like endonuclease